jgi:hypothetical protein
MKPDNADVQLERLNAVDAPELHQAVVAAKGQLPSAQQLAALAASLSALGVPVKPATLTPAARLPAPTHLRIWLAAGLVGPVALALLFWPSKAVRPTSPTAVASSSSSNVERASAPGPTEPRPGAVSASAEPGGSASAAEGQPDAAAAPIDAARADAASGARKTAPGHASQGQPAAPTSGALTPTAPAPGQRERASELNSANAVAPPTEVALLRDAQLALRTNPNEALALTEQHRTLFARGVMLQERELIAISALARLGRHTAVLARAAQFAHDFPSSPYRKQVEALAQ